FGDVAPIHDRRAKLLVAPVDFLGQLVAGADLGDDVFADLVKGLQQGVVNFRILTVPSLRSLRSDSALLALNSAKECAYSEVATASNERHSMVLISISLASPISMCVHQVTMPQPVCAENLVRLMW